MSLKDVLEPMSKEQRWLFLIRYARAHALKAAADAAAAKKKTEK